MTDFTRTRDRVSRRLVPALFILCSSCMALHMPGIYGFPRPPELVGEWVDVQKSTASDTSVWVLRANGYDGSAHLRVVSGEGGAMRIERTESKYGSWYLDGSLTDSTRRALCFARRLGRSGRSCIRFSLDTIPNSNGVRRIVLIAYEGQHHTSDRELIARRP